jgi:hypothetical protein
MSWWSRMKGKLGGGQDGNDPPSEDSRTVSPTAEWRDAAATTFGFAILDLTPATRGMVSFTQDPAIAKRAISWARSTGSELDVAHLEGLAPIACELRYPVAPILPDGLLFTPSCMEEKWVLAHRKGTVLAARSWTGIVDAVAETQRDGDVLVIRVLRVRETSVLRRFGDPVQVFDWLIRSHALRQGLPLPVDGHAMATLEKTPLVAFSAFGRMAPCASRTFAPSRPSHPLRSDGAVLAAVRSGDVARVKALCHAGEPVDAPTTMDGYTPLSAALIRRDVAMVRVLLELGADPNKRSGGGSFPLGHGIVHAAPLEALEALVAAGADPKDVNEDGFGTLHAAAEAPG